MKNIDSHLEKDVGVFISTHKEKYQIISKFQNLLNNMKKETYEETINFVKINHDTFFKDRESGILFLFNINYFTIFNYKQLELILDVLIYFLPELKRIGIDELDLIDMNKHLLCDINYLFNKKAISIQSIIQKSVYLEQLFINFYPEINEYDHEYAMLREESLFSYNQDPLFVKEVKLLFNFIKSNPQKHFAFKNQNYCPLPLHKAIRDDDIEKFKEILLKDKYDINHKFEYSFYERTFTFDKNPSLIQVAAVYGSLKIFEFLWNQKQIIPDENLLCYAYSGRNREIINICEKKCSTKHILYYAIFSHQKDLIDELMMNPKYHSDKSDIPGFIDNDDNIYKKLNRENLMAIIRSENYNIMFPFLNKIVYIMQKIEDNTANPECDTFLQNCFYDLDLFKFLYSNKNPKFDLFKGNPPKYLLAIDNAAFDVIRFLIKNEKPQNILTVFRDALKLNGHIANYILDFQIQEKKEKKKNTLIFDLFKSQLGIDDLAVAIQFYNEKIIIKMNQLYGIIDNNPKKFVSLLIKSASTLMINSLFSNNMAYISNVNANYIAGILRQSGFEESANYIYSDLTDEN